MGFDVVSWWLKFFQLNQPEYVYLAAAKVGGIGANKDYPGHFIYDNLMIQSNIIHAARKFGVKKLLFLGSSCIYPKMCEQPIKEEYLLVVLLNPAMILMRLQRLPVSRCVRHIVSNMDLIQSL